MSDIKYVIGFYWSPDVIEALEELSKIKVKAYDIPKIIKLKKQVMALREDLEETRQELVKKFSDNGGESVSEENFNEFMMAFNAAANEEVDLPPKISLDIFFKVEAELETTLVEKLWFIFDELTEDEEAKE